MLILLSSTVICRTISTRAPCCACCRTAVSDLHYITCNSQIQDVSWSARSPNKIVVCSSTTSDVELWNASDGRREAVLNGQTSITSGNQGFLAVHAFKVCTPYQIFECYGFLLASIAFLFGLLPCLCLSALHDSTGRFQNLQHGGCSWQIHLLLRSYMTEVSAFVSFMWLYSITGIVAVRSKQGGQNTALLGAGLPAHAGSRRIRSSSAAMGREGLHTGFHVTTIDA
jgi:hypothetical protein